jgi:hypothetical protein
VCVELDPTALPTVKLHLWTPDAASTAYSFSSSQPTKTVAPSGLSAGDERTAPWVVKLHRLAPDVALRAYSLEVGVGSKPVPKKTIAPSGLITGFDITAFSA